MYFVNWQRNVSVSTYEGRPAVVKTNKSTKAFHEFILISVFSLLSIFFAHPSRPNVQVFSSTGEGMETRRKLAEIGIATPILYSISNDTIVEEYVDGGDLYSAFEAGRNTQAMAYQAGLITATAHRAGLVFADNKAQNYLVRGNDVLRTDLSFIQETRTVYARSVDVGSFLASVIDLDSYPQIENEFFLGYRAGSGTGFPYLSIILRNVLAVGFSSRGAKAVQNMLLNSQRLICG